eukprot:sb/3477204/
MFTVLILHKFPAQRLRTNESMTQSTKWGRNSVQSYQLVTCPNWSILIGSKKAISGSQWRSGRPAQYKYIYRWVSGHKSTQHFLHRTVYIVHNSRPRGQLINRCTAEQCIY